MNRLFFIIYFYLFSAIIPAQQYEPVTKFDPARNPEQDLKSAIEYAHKRQTKELFLMLEVNGVSGATELMLLSNHIKR